MEKDDIRKLQKILDVEEFLGEDIDSLKTAEDIYHFLKKAFEKEKRPAEVKKELREIKKAAEKLSDIFKKSSTVTKMFVNNYDTIYSNQAYIKHGCYIPYLWATGQDMYPSPLILHLDKIINFCARDLSTIPADKGGVKKDIILNDLIRNLVCSYKLITGKKPTITWDNYGECWGGKFYQFVYAFLKAVGNNSFDLVGQGLGQRIKRVLQGIKYYE